MTTTLKIVYEQNYETNLTITTLKVGQSVPGTEISLDT